jgi:Cytochrome c/c1 heme lyase
MGTTASTPATPKAETKVPSELNKGTPANVQTTASFTTDSESSGGCPMKQSDGSYTYDWKTMFQKHPHGSKGSVPLGENANQNETRVQDKDRDGACPVKEYNVYSQPIDPTNQMPAVANQLPAPGQTEELSTSRVSSSISKVGVVLSAIHRRVS